MYEEEEMDQNEIQGKAKKTNKRRKKEANNDAEKTSKNDTCDEERTVAELG